MRKKLFHLPLRIKLAVVFAVVASATGLLFSPSSASAGIYTDWAQYGSPALSEGYFSNGGINDTNPANRAHCVPDPNARCPVLPNNNYAVDAFDRYAYHGGNQNKIESEKRARQFVNDLKNKYAGQGQWGATGAAFIANSLLGRGSDSPQKTRIIDDATWTEIENRLVERSQKGMNGMINWDIAIDNNGKYDTYTVNINGQWDIAYEHKSDKQNGMEVYNDDGSFAFRMWYSCANPIGDFSGLPPVAPSSDFSLTPSVTVDRTVAEPNTSANVTGVVQNGGSTASAPGTKWQLIRVVVDPGRPIPQIGNTANPRTSPQAACPAFYSGPGVTRCDPIPDSTQPGGFPSGSITVIKSNEAVGDELVGTHICFGLSVQPVSSTSGDWAHSPLVCIVVSKKPSLNVTGGDVVVGKGAATPSNISTSTSVKTLSPADRRIFGSWGEYGVTATGTISGMASAAGYAKGQSANGGESADQLFCGVSYLTITNATGGTACDTPSATTNGGYAMAADFPPITGEFPIPTDAAHILSNRPATGDITIGSSMASGIYTTALAASLTINTSQIVPGQWIVINAPTANITIAGNIKYTNGTLTKIQDIPQVIIIANTISIAETVDQVDSWLIATGELGDINTCSRVPKGSPAGNLNAGVCATKLIVNGPVVARHLYLYRTAGSLTAEDTADPAEVFNLRPDAYLWATQYKKDTSRLQTASTVELPPRY